MSMPLSPTRLLVCSACGAVLPVGPELLGKKCRCGRCGKISLISENHDAEDSPQRKTKPSPDPNQRIGFRCRVCDTGLAARVKDIGRKAKCPDCGALTQVPPPPKPKKKNVPKAMHGQQYGLWGVDDAPTPAEMKAKQPTFFPVFCRNCNTMMHAQPKQIGKKLSCPDCGAKTAVKEPPKTKPKKSALVPDGQEYQLDAKHVPPKRELPQFVHAPTVARETKERIVADPIRQERVARPKIPRLPILQGVMKMLVRTPVVTWFAWVTLVGLIAGGFLLVTMMLNPVAAIPFFLGAAAAAILSLSAIGAFCLAVLTESSEGNDRLYHPPGPMFLDWMGDVFYLVFPAVLAMVPGSLLAVALQQELPRESQGLLMFVGWLFTFPLLLLSSLENGSFLEPFSFRIFGSVAKRPGLWLLFVAESAVIIGGTLAAAIALANRSPLTALEHFTIDSVVSIVYF